ncbi:MAG: hypothetical protein K6G09_01570 [Treponema sp.]|nr:hypothetical protein [Treponema sp.]
MKADSFILIFYWMVSELPIKGIERDLYAIINGFSQNGELHQISINYFAYWTGSTIRGVQKALNNLLQKELIIIKRIPGKPSLYGINTILAKEAAKRAVLKQPENVQKLKEIHKQEFTSDNIKQNQLLKEALSSVQNQIDSKYRELKDKQVLCDGQTRKELRDFLKNNDWTISHKEEE